MGRAIIGVVFVIAFVIFALIRFVIVGTKAAYEAVFDPNAKGEREQAIIGECMMAVNHAMRDISKSKLSLAILKLTSIVQAMILKKGYRVDSVIARSIVCDAIVIYGHATREEVNRA